jgi:hypothetical protein
VAKESKTIIYFAHFSLFIRSLQYCCVQVAFHSSYQPLSILQKAPMFDTLLSKLETDLRAALGTCVTGLVATARTQLESAHSDVAKERVQGLAEVAEERAKALAEVDASRAALGREVAAMHMHKEAQKGRIVLNIGGFRFETSVQTLRRVPHTFFDAYFSGRYAQDVCNDGSIFVDRDGEHFGHVLEYMRDGVVSVAEAGFQPSVSLLRALKREFGFYCIELDTEEAIASMEPTYAFVIGGVLGMSSMERYDSLSGQWSAVADMGTARSSFGACAFEGDIYVIGGEDAENLTTDIVERYSPSGDFWSVVAPLPLGRSGHAAIAVGSAIHVLGGNVEVDIMGLPDYEATASVLKYDSAQGVWNQVAPLPEARENFAACAVGNDIFVFGGRDENDRAQDSVFKYDTEANEWSTLGPMPCSTSGHTASFCKGLIYILGSTASGIHRVLRFDPISMVYATSVASALNNHWRGVSFVLGDYLYAAGGSTHRRSVERYDMESNTWTAVVDMAHGRFDFSAVVIGPTGQAEEQDLFDYLIAKASSQRS